MFYSDEMVVKNLIILLYLLVKNLDLMEKRVLDVFVVCVEVLMEEGIVVIVNDYIMIVIWCCGVDFCDVSWSNDWLLGVVCKVR